MAIAFVATATGSQQGPIAAHTSNTFNSTGANFIVAGISCSNVLTSVSDNKSNGNYTLYGPFNNGTDNVYLAVKESPGTVGAGHTITANAAAGSFFAIAPACYSGLASSGSADKTANAGGNSTALNSGNMATTTNANELILVTGTLSTGADGVFSSVNYNIRSQNGAASTGGVTFLGERIVAATGTYAGDAAWSNAAGLWECLVRSFSDTPIGGDVLQPQACF